MQVVHSVKNVINFSFDGIFLIEIILVNCSVLPLCPYYSSISCIAVDVPLECPRLCGLCERYEILKSIYGEENLAPDASTTTSTTTRKR
jgi:hypothetical protein